MIRLYDEKPDYLVDEDRAPERRPQLEVAAGDEQQRLWLLAAISGDAGIRGIGPLQMLEANRRLVELLIDQRWSVIEAARESGASWEVIGAALGISRQGARDWYTRKIIERDRDGGWLRRHVPAGHDNVTALDAEDAHGLKAHRDSQHTNGISSASRSQNQARYRSAVDGSSSVRGVGGGKAS